MSKLGDIISSLTLNTREIKVKELPTQGFFYPKKMKLSIKKASYEDVKSYNENLIKASIPSILNETKKIIRKNIILSNGMKYEDLKSNDLLYIFFEIVKFTMNKKIIIPYINEFGENDTIEFSSKTFNYFDNRDFCEYDSEKREFIKYGYRFSLPSVGAEHCIINYINNYVDKNAENNYDFLFFLGNKNYLSNEEIENLIIIFTEDIDDTEKEKISEIVDYVRTLILYSLRTKTGYIVELDSRIDFQGLFK